VWEIISRRASEASIPMSQYVADVLAEHVGRNDLVLTSQPPKPHPMQEELPLLP